ncbi:MAG: hypothetical protein GF384_06795 [Elusimicrobia bacterium]|nr:hypothetical protein [Elusimicrobiota bacterium]MBD3412408.1 hypothetical protein [Elusimicrobiota bacterium]
MMKDKNIVLSAGIIILILAIISIPSKWAYKKSVSIMKYISSTDHTTHRPAYSFRDAAHRIMIKTRLCLHGMDEWIHNAVEGHRKLKRERWEEIQKRQQARAAAHETMQKRNAKQIKAHKEKRKQSVLSHIKRREEIHGRAQTKPTIISTIVHAITNLIHTIKVRKIAYFINCQIQEQKRVLEKKHKQEMQAEARQQRIAETEKSRKAQEAEKKKQREAAARRLAAEAQKNREEEKARERQRALAAEKKKQREAAARRLAAEAQKKREEEQSKKPLIEKPQHKKTPSYKTVTLIDPMENLERWNFTHESQTLARFDLYRGITGKGIAMYFNLFENGWVSMQRLLSLPLDDYQGIRFSYLGTGALNSLEIILTHDDIPVLKRVLKTTPREGSGWEQVTLEFSEMSVMPGGSEKSHRNAINRVIFTIKHNENDQGGRGRVVLDNLELVK